MANLTTPQSRFKIYRCDAEFIPTMNIKIQRGRNFIEGQDGSNYIMNKKAVAAMGLDLENAVGTTLEMWNGKGRIVGVTDDFHNDNLRFGIEPMIFMYSENVGSHYFIKLSGQTPVAEQISQIEGVFRKHNPDYPFEYTFLRRCIHPGIPDRKCDREALIKLYFHCRSHFMSGLIWSCLIHRRKKNQGNRDPKSNGRFGSKPYHDALP